MKNKLFKRILLLLTAVCILSGNIIAYAEDTGETVEQRTSQLVLVGTEPENALSGDTVTVGALSSVLIKTHFPFITGELRLTHNSEYFNRTMEMTIVETGMSYTVSIEKNTTETPVALQTDESVGARSIKLKNSGVLAVKLSKITAVRDEAKYAYGSISSFVEIDYTENEAALKTASVFSDNSPIALIRNARRYLCADDMSVKPVRYNEETYVTSDIVRETFRITVEENSDGTVTVKDKDVAELLFGASGCTVRKGVQTTNEENPYIISEGRRLLPVGYIADIFGMKTHYSDGITVVDEPHRIKSIIGNESLLSHVRQTIETVQTVTGRELHVSQNDANADDENAGTLQAPFKTINAAAAAAQAGDKIIVHGGVYRETVTFENDGLPGAPITLEGAEGEEVTVSAADEITKPIKYKDNSFFAILPEAKKYRNQIYINGEAYSEGRQPNSPNVEGRIVMSDYLDLCPLWPMEGDISNSDYTKKFELTSENSLTEEREDYWKYSVFIGLVHEGWKTAASVVKKSREGSIIIEGEEKYDGLSFGYLGYSENYRDTDYGYLTEHVSTVDMPGEWVIKGNTLYMLMPDGISTDDALIEYKARQLLFDLTGRKNICIRNIKGFGGSVNMKNSELCMLSDCDFKYISHFTWFADNREGFIDDRTDETENGAQARGEVGIYVGGCDNVVKDCNMNISAGAGLYIAGRYSYIYNNNLTECGYAGTMCNGIYIGFEPWRVDSSDYSVQPCVGGHSIYYNSVSKCGRSPVAVNGGYTLLLSQMPTRFAAMDIAYNDFYEGGVMSGRDGGLYYSYCVGLGDDIIRTKFHNNLLWDYYAYDDFDVGIYLDAGTTDSEFYQNVCFYTNDKANYNSVERNIGGQDQMTNANSFCYDNGSALFVPDGKTGLEADDYPGGFVFRSGSTLAGGETPQKNSASAYWFKNGGLSDGILSNEFGIKPSSNEATVKMSNVDFGDGSNAVKITYKGNIYSSADKLEFRLDSKDGTKILSKSLKTTAPTVGDMVTVTLDTAPVSGTHDVYVSFPVVSSLEYVSFAPFKRTDVSAASLYKFCSSFDAKGNLNGTPQIGADDIKINGTLNGNWVRYEGCYLKDSFNAFRITYSTEGKYSGNIAKIILDDLQNEPIATLTFNGDSWSTRVEARADISGKITTGLHDVYILFGGGTFEQSNAYEFEFFTE